MTKQMKKDPLDKKEPENTLLVHETYGKAVWRRFCRHRLALISLAALGIICGAAVFAPVIAPYDPEAIAGPFGAAPSREFLLGAGHNPAGIWQAAFFMLPAPRLWRGFWLL